jgi:OPT oligopeptide transporter protein
VLYIGAGAVAAGGIISLFRSLPVILHGLKEGVRDLRGGTAASLLAPRTDQDISMKYVLGGIILLVIGIMAARTLHMNLLGAIMIIVFGFLFVTVSSRLTGEIGSSSNPISGMTVATLLLTCLVFLIIGWTGPAYYVTALSVGAIVCIAASNGGTTSQDLKTGFLVGATPRMQQLAILIGAFGSALILGPILLALNNTGAVYVPRVTFQRVDKSVQIPDASAVLLPYEEMVKPDAGNYRVFRNDQNAVPDLAPGEYLVSDSGTVAYKIQQNFPAEMKADVSKLGKSEQLQGPQRSADSNTYRVWHKIDEQGGPAGRYLVKEDGTPVYLVDPGINGVHRVRPDGTKVDKFDAPKATLMSYIIKGILNRQLPWGLVILGAMIAIVLEMSGIPSLAFAVGVYLPLSSSSPIFIGGFIRWLVDRKIRNRLRHKNLTEEQLVAEGDKSQGVLMASGYIAGGAIAGIVIAFLAGVLTDYDRRIQEWSVANNPLFHGPLENVLPLIPFAILIGILLMTGRGSLFAPKQT